MRTLFFVITFFLYINQVYANDIKGFSYDTVDSENIVEIAKKVGDVVKKQNTATSSYDLTPTSSSNDLCVECEIPLALSELVASVLKKADNLSKDSSSSEVMAELDELDIMIELTKDAVYNQDLANTACNGARASEFTTKPPIQDYAHGTLVFSKEFPLESLGALGIANKGSRLYFYRGRGEQKGMVMSVAVTPPNSVSIKYYDMKKRGVKKTELPNLGSTGRHVQKVTRAGAWTSVSNGKGATVLEVGPRVDLVDGAYEKASVVDLDYRENLFESSSFSTKAEVSDKKQGLGAEWQTSFESSDLTLGTELTVEKQHAVVQLESDSKSDKLSLQVDNEQVIEYEAKKSLDLGSEKLFLHTKGQLKEEVWSGSFTVSDTDNTELVTVKSHDGELAFEVPTRLNVGLSDMSIDGHTSVDKSHISGSYALVERNEKIVSYSFKKARKNDYMKQTVQKEMDFKGDTGTFLLKLNDVSGAEPNSGEVNESSLWLTFEKKF